MKSTNVNEAFEKYKTQDDPYDFSEYFFDRDTICLEFSKLLKSNLIKLLYLEYCNDRIEASVNIKDFSALMVAEISKLKKIISMEQENKSSNLVKHDQNLTFDVSEIRRNLKIIEKEMDKYEYLTSLKNEYENILVYTNSAIGELLKQHNLDDQFDVNSITGERYYKKEGGLGIKYLIRESLLPFLELTNEKLTKQNSNVLNKEIENSKVITKDILYTNENKIKWFGTEAQFEYLVELLKEEKFITDHNTYALLNEHFEKRDGSPFNFSQTKQNRINSKSGKPKNPEKIENIIDSIKKKI